MRVYDQASSEYNYCIDYMDRMDNSVKDHPPAVRDSNGLGIRDNQVWTNGEVYRLRAENAVLTQVIAHLTEQISLLGSHLRSLSVPRVTLDAEVQCNILFQDPYPSRFYLRNSSESLLEEDEDLPEVPMRKRAGSYARHALPGIHDESSSLFGSFRKNRSFSLRSSQYNLPIVLPNASQNGKDCCSSSLNGDVRNLPPPLRRLKSFTSLNVSPNRLNPFSRSFVLRKEKRQKLSIDNTPAAPPVRAQQPLIDENAVARHFRARSESYV